MHLLRVAVPGQVDNIITTANVKETLYQLKSYHQWLKDLGKVLRFSKKRVSGTTVLVASSGTECVCLHLENS